MYQTGIIWESSMKETFHSAVRVCLQGLDQIWGSLERASEEVAFRVTPEGWVRVVQAGGWGLMFEPED